MSRKERKKDKDKQERRKKAADPKENEIILDEDLFSYIQPKGGITFKDPAYIQSGDGYVRCLHVYELPNTLNNFWLNKIYNLQDTICSIDISTKDLATVKKNINLSIGEENARYGTAKNHMERYDAAKRIQELQSLYDQLSSMGEVVKACDFRIFVKDRTLMGLEEKCDKLIKDIEGDSFRVATLLNEQKQEWQSLFSSFSRSHQIPFALKGLNLTSEQLAIGYPFNYSELLDEQGTLLGFTETGGVVLFDEFTATKKRQSYNTVTCGGMGSGKSTFLKKRFKHHASIGNFVRTFDVSGEFADLTKEFGGKIINCNGSEGMLNPLEILKYVEDDNESFAKHITKMQTFYRCIVPSITDMDLQSLANQLRGLYETWNLTPGQDREITSKDPSEYPTLSNFKDYLTLKLQNVAAKDMAAATDVETTLNVREAETLRTLITATENLVKNYGYIFDGYTSIKDITNEKIVTFDISGIKHLGDVFTAQMQNLVSLCWDNAVKNGVKQKALWESGEVPSQDIVKFYMIVDESHEWVNTKMPHILDMIITYMREARKYFAGITLASQSIRDYMPEGAEEGSERIKKLFELSQYVFMFRQPSSALPHIRSVFGESLTYSQIDKIPRLERGQTVMAIQGDRSILFNIWLSKDYEEKLFKGGR